MFPLQLCTMILQNYCVFQAGKGDKCWEDIKLSDEWKAIEAECGTDKDDITAVINLIITNFQNVQTHRYVLLFTFQCGYKCFLEKHHLVRKIECVYMGLNIGI